MKVLVIGSGAREHSLVWKIKQSPKVKKIYASPGNAGIEELAEIVDIKPDDIKGLLRFAEQKNIDLTVVGPESPLVGGIVDEFEREGLKIFGPNKFAAQLEGSKIFAKEIMLKLAVPTADFKVFNEYKKAKDYVCSLKPPMVIKADGLAQGKGVIIASSTKEGCGAIDLMMVDKIFGSAGTKIVVEDCLKGEEASILVLSDGKNVVPLASSQDHKRIFDNDQGPNTGGMGAYSPAPIVTDEIFKQIMEEIINPIITGMQKEGKPYKGVLYAGIMITKDGPKVLEFNVRFGDPETQAILPRLNTDLVDLIEASISGQLGGMKLKWTEKSCLAVVLASGGYPGEYQKEKKIFGLEELKTWPDIFVFHAGTKKFGKDIVTSGGRVLNVVGLGESIEQAMEYTYKAVEKIKFEGRHYRKDIGKRALHLSAQQAPCSPTNF